MYPYRIAVTGQKRKRKVTDNCVIDLLEEVDR